MSSEYYLRRDWIAPVVVFFAILIVPSARANIYATSIKMNGSSTNWAVASGSTNSITYILNQPAASVSVNILSGTAVVRSLVSTDPTNTARGLNLITWDGRNNSGQNIALGSYSLSVTATSIGYTNWTQISSDADDTNTFVIGGQGIAVDQNPGSPFYGRVFVANAWQGPDPANTPGDAVGILKYNPDTSGADEGIASTGVDGYDWTGDNLSPWKVQVSAGDYVYVSDLAAGGSVGRWDPTISSNSLLPVLRQDNRSAGGTLFGPAIVGSGPNTHIWMSDTNNAQTQGLAVRLWGVTGAGECATNDLGTTVLVGGTNLTLGPAAIALDQSSNLYVCQFVSDVADALPRVFRFPAPSTNGSQPELAPNWAVGTNDDTYGGASDIAIDPSGTYVAVAFQGVADVNQTITNGNTKVLYSTNGAVAANIDLNLDIDGIGDATHQDTACAWDGVGNLYYIDSWVGHWRVVSPPGTNTATTLAPAVLQVTGSSGGPAPQITSISFSNGLVVIAFSAQTTDVASAFELLGSSSAAGPYSVLANATIKAGQVPGQFEATVSSSAAVEFYRIQRVGGSPPPPELQITSLALSAGQVTLQFTSTSTDLPSAFTLLSASGAAGPFSTATGASITATSTPGVFQALVPAIGSVQFYRIQK